MNYAIVTAAGKGARFGGNKSLHPLRKRPLLAWALQQFEKSSSIDEILLVLPPGEPDTQYKKICANENFTKVVFLHGGDTRADSVRNGFGAVKKMDGFVVVHDAARPLLSIELLETVIAATLRHGAAIPVLPVQETVKEVEGDRIVRTVPREQLFIAQTPQGFRTEILAAAYSKIKDSNHTDEATLVELAGYEVHVVKGERRNLKITEASDIQLAEAYL